MPRRDRSLIPRTRLWVVFAASVVGCGDAATPAPAPAAVETRTGDDKTAPIEAFVASPTVPGLLVALSASHEAARRALGPHVLRYELRHTVTPREIPELPAVDEGTPRVLDVQDLLELRWASAPGEPPRFHLKQGPPGVDNAQVEHELIVLDEQAYTRLPHRGWLTRPLDGSIHEQWLDDAQRSVHDLVEFAAPALALAVVEDGDAVVITLSKADASGPASTRHVGQAWREHVQFDRVAGTIALDRATGRWREATVELTYHLEDDAGRPVDGALTFAGTLTPAEGLTIEAPPAEPLPERLRLEEERKRLLDGLAAF